VRRRGDAKLRCRGGASAILPYHPASIPTKAPALAIAAVAVTLSANLLLILSGGIAALVLLIYTGIALPAVWSTKPAHPKAAADVLRLVRNARTGRGRR
jgi:hypothetical protein